MGMGLKLEWSRLSRCIISNYTVAWRRLIPLDSVRLTSKPFAFKYTSQTDRE